MMAWALGLLVVGLIGCAFLVVALGLANDGAERMDRP